MITRLTTLLHDRSGAAAVEMALVIGLLVGLVLLVFDVTNAFTTKTRLEQAAQRAAELALSPGSIGSNYAYVATEAQSAYGRPVRSSTVETWLECNGTRQATFGAICPQGQQSARYLAVVVQADYTPAWQWGGYLVSTMTGNGLTMTGDATVRLQ